MALSLLSNVDPAHDALSEGSHIHVPHGPLGDVENAIADTSRSRDTFLPQPSSVSSRWFIERGPAKMSWSGRQFTVAKASRVVAYGGFAVRHSSVYHFRTKITTQWSHPIPLKISIGLMPLSMMISTKGLQLCSDRWPRDSIFILEREAIIRKPVKLECGFNGRGQWLYILQDDEITASKPWANETHKPYSRAGYSEELLCPVIEVATLCRSWKNPAKFYTVHLSPSFFDDSRRLPGRISNHWSLPVMNLTDKPTELPDPHMQEDQWKYITTEQSSEHRFRGHDGTRLLCSYFELNLPYEHYKMAPLFVGFMEAKTGQYCLYYSDGRVYTNESTVVCARKGPRCSNGDVIGCGFDFNAGGVFYTRNGLFVGILHRQRLRSSLRGQQLPWQPIIGFTGEEAKFMTNFGHQSFLYDLRQHEEFMNLYNAAHTPRWPAIARPMTFPPEILSMILTFLSLQLLDLQRGDQYIEIIQCLQACRLSCRAWATLLRSAAFWQVRLISSATLSAFVNATLSSQSSQDFVRIAQVIEGDQAAGEVEWSYQCLVLPRLGSVDALYLDHRQQNPRRAWSVRQRLPPRLTLNPWIPFSAFSNVTRLELRNHVSRSFVIFTRLLSTFRRLRQLSCIETCWEDRPSQHFRKCFSSDCLESVDFTTKTFFPAQWQIADFFINCSRRRRACARPRVHTSDGELIRQVAQLLIVWQNSSTKTFLWTSKYTGIDQILAHKQTWTYDDVDDFAFSKTITFRLYPRLQTSSEEESEVHYLTELEIAIHATPNQLGSDASAQAPGWRAFKRAMTWSILDTMLKNAQLSSLTSVRVVYELNEWDHDIVIWTCYGLLRRMPYCRHAKLLWVVSSAGKVFLDPANYSSVLNTSPVGWNDAEEYEPGLVEGNNEALGF